VSTPEEKKPEKTPIVRVSPIASDEEYDCDDVIPFSVKRKGTVHHYCIGHMSGQSRDEYMSHMSKIRKRSTDAEGNPKVVINDYTGMSTMILKHCVYGYVKAINGSGGVSTGELVSEEVVASFPTKLLERLLVTANVLNALPGAEDDSTGKKDSTVTNNSSGTE
jgi:hypothetical protein